MFQPFKSRAQHSGKSEEDKNGLDNAEAQPGEIKKSKHMSKRERQMAKKNASKVNWIVLCCLVDLLGFYYCQVYFQENCFCSNGA